MYSGPAASLAGAGSNRSSIFLTFGAEGPDALAVRKANSDFDAAELRRDFDALERMLAEDFVWTTFAGGFLDRAAND